MFVRYLPEGASAIELPLESKGIVVRTLNAADRQNPIVARYTPREARRYQTEALVAVRENRIVGAIWYTSAVSSDQPWFAAVAPHVQPPAVLTANLYVVPGDKPAAWTLAKTGSDYLAGKGVRTIVGDVSSDNKPSILMTRLLGGRIVARMSVRYSFGIRSTSIETVTVDRDAAVTSARRKGKRKPGATGRSR